MKIGQIIKLTHEILGSLPLPADDPETVKVKKDTIIGRLKKVFAEESIAVSNEALNHYIDEMIKLAAGLPIELPEHSRHGFNEKVYRELLPYAKLALLAVGSDKAVEHRAEEHAYRLAVLFGDKNNALKYLENYAQANKASEPLFFDACNPIPLPGGNWDIQLWQGLAKKHLQIKKHNTEEFRDQCDKFFPAFAHAEAIESISKNKKRVRQAALEILGKKGEEQKVIEELSQRLQAMQDGAEKSHLIKVLKVAKQIHEARKSEPEILNKKKQIELDLDKLRGELKKVQEKPKEGQEKPKKVVELTDEQRQMQAESKRNSERMNELNSQLQKGKELGQSEVERQKKLEEHQKLKDRNQELNRLMRESMQASKPKQTLSLSPSSGILAEPQGTQSPLPEAEVIKRQISTLERQLQSIQRRLETIQSFTHLEDVGLSNNTSIAEFSRLTAEIHYVNADENPEAAHLFRKYRMTQESFDEYLALRQKIEDKIRKGDNIPDITIEGAELGYPKGTVYLKKLEPDDERAAVTGQTTACCLHLDAAGVLQTKQAIVSPNGNFYVLCEGDAENPRKSDRIISACLAWRSQTGAMVFESVEIAPTKRISKGQMVSKFFGTLAYQLVKDKNIPLVTVGYGGDTHTPDDLGFSFIPGSERGIAGEAWGSDSFHQRTIAKKDKLGLTLIALGRTKEAAEYFSQHADALMRDPDYLIGAVICGALDNVHEIVKYLTVHNRMKDQRFTSDLFKALVDAPKSQVTTKTWECIKYLIEQGVLDPEFNDPLPDNFKNIFVVASAHSSGLALIKYLVEVRKMDPSGKPGVDDFHPADIAIEKSNFDIVKYYLENPVFKMDDKKRDKILKKCFHKGFEIFNLELIKYAIEKNPNILHSISSPFSYIMQGRKPLNEQQVLELLKFIIEKGVDINVNEKYGAIRDTPIKWAQRKNYKVVAQYLESLAIRNQREQAARQEATAVQNRQSQQSQQFTEQRPVSTQEGPAQHERDQKGRKEAELQNKGKPGAPPI